MQLYATFSDKPYIESSTRTKRGSENCRKITVKREFINGYFIFELCEQLCELFDFIACNLNLVFIGSY